MMTHAGYEAVAAEPGHSTSRWLAWVAARQKMTKGDYCAKGPSCGKYWVIWKGVAARGYAGLNAPGVHAVRCECHRFHVWPESLEGSTLSVDGLEEAMRVARLLSVRES